MISVLQAQELIDRHTEPLVEEERSLAHIHGCVLREPVATQEDIPAFDRSAMDGYAVRRDETAVDLEVIGEIRAGQTKDQPLQPGQAIRILTGARLPGDGLKVVVQEHVEVRENRIHITKQTSATHVRKRGEDARAGEVLLKPGLTLDAAAVALLASVGKTLVSVSQRPRVLHLTTGDEIVPPEQTPDSGQIRNSNASLVAGLCRECGVGEVSHFHAGDDLQQMVELLSVADMTAYDMVLISGGSGQGTYDFSAALFQHLRVPVHFREVNVRPGKPLIFGSTPFLTVFGLPGNALSHFVCFHLFVRRALDRLLARPGCAPTHGFLADPMPETQNARETWWPAQVGLREGRLEVCALPWKSSGDITRLPGANALIHVPASTAQISAGTMVEVLLTRYLSS